MNVSPTCSPVSRQDLLDYLSQLLGQDGDQVREFVADVGRYKKGEKLAEQTIEEEEKKEPSPTPRQRQENYMEATKSTTTTAVAAQQKGKSKLQQKRNNNNKTAAGRGGNNNQKSASLAKKQAAKQAQPKQQSPSPPTQTPVVKNDEAPKAAAAKLPDKPKKEAPPAPKKSHPPKGKASKVCGCFGRTHKALTNCLYCGRISCEREGYDYCAFCGYLNEKLDAKPPADGYVLHNRIHLFFVPPRLARKDSKMLTLSLFSILFFPTLKKKFQGQGLLAQGTLAAV